MRNSPKTEENLQEKNFSESPEPKKDSYKKWNQKENEIYATFLEKHICIMRPNASRKPRNFFLNMSNLFKGKKTNEQCRSHHRKMIEIYKTP